MSGFRSKKAVFLLTVWIVWGFFALCGAADDERAYFQTRDLIVFGPRSAEPTAQYLLNSFPQVMSDLDRALGWKLGYVPTVVLIEDRGLFEEMSGSPYVSAYAVPGKRAIVISLPAAGSRPYVLNETFQHELCHLILHDHIRSSHLPKWLDEGVCQWVSGSLGELLIGQKDFATGSIDLSRNAFALSRLTDRFPAEKHALFLAYEESRKFVDYITAQYGKQGLLGILEEMKAGEGVEGAVHKRLSKPLETLEEEWRRQLNRKSLWLIRASQYIYEILFFLSAVLAILAFVRLRIKRGRYIDEEEGEDEPPLDGEER